MSQATVVAQSNNTFSDDKIQVDRGDIFSLIGILKYAKGRTWGLILAIFLILCSTLAVMIAATLLGKLVEQLSQPMLNLAQIQKLALGFLALELSSVVLKFLGRTKMARVSNGIIFDLRCRLFKKLELLPISYFDQQPMGRTITRLTSDVAGVEELFVNTLARVLIALFAIISVFIAMFAMNPIFGSLIVLSAMPAIYVNYRYKNRTIDHMRGYKKASATTNSRLAENLSGLFVLRMFNLENWSMRMYEKDIKSYFSECMRLLNWNTFLRPMTVFLCALPTLVVILVGGQKVLAGTMAVSMFVMYLRYCEHFIDPVRSISQEFQKIQEAFSSSERVNQMLNEVEENTVFDRNGQFKEKIKGEVRFEQVWKSYQKGYPVLKGVSFAAQVGEKIGLVGATGSGKSSTMNLIPRLYPFESGQILIDGVALGEWDRESLRSQLGVVSQDVIIFKGTLRENLLGAILDGSTVNDDKLILAMKKTGLFDVVAKFEKGLDTDIFEGGENLSVGEKQLIAMTRMLVRDPAILLMDEATASIDEHYESIIQSAVTHVMQGRTCFIIAHRLSTIVNCDRILVFQAGEIVESGTHKDLMLQNGVYAKLATMQLKGENV